MTIKLLDISGFQCHRRTVVELDPYITVLVGDNGVGKSALVRALKWFALNQWDGKADQMISWDMDEARVLGVVDAYEIIRSKGPKGNTYQIKDSILEAVGAGKVPDPVAKILNMSEDNFQEQLDPAFWFHLTSGQVAKSLNKIVNLNSIDTSLERVAGELRDARQDVKNTEQRITDARSIKESLSWTKDADAILKTLEGLAFNMARNRATSSSLALVIEQSTKQAAVLQTASDAIQEGERAIEAGHEFFKCGNKIKKLKGLIDQAETQETKACELRRKLDMVQKRLEEKTGLLCEECGGTGIKS